MTPIHYIYWYSVCFAGLLTYCNSIKMHWGAFFKLQRKNERSLSKTLHVQPSPQLVQVSEAVPPVRVSKALGVEQKCSLTAVLQKVI